MSNPTKISKSQATDLAVVIDRMQKSADQVEKNILATEDMLTVDTERKGKKQPFIHQKENTNNLMQAENLLKSLFMDVDKAKKLKHPQALEIEKDVINLHDRWVKDCTIYREVYSQGLTLDPKQTIDWGPLLDEKLKQLKADAYGPSLSDVEKQIAAHNILHQQVEAYKAQLEPSNTTSQEQYAAFKDKYAKLCEASQQRRNHLASLYEYLHSCNKELVYLSGQQERILQRDWSDRMVDPQGLRMEYEKFKNSGLIAHESEINKLQQEGSRLIEMKHPGSSTMEEHRDAVQSEWQSFLNLCLAKEKHLGNIDDYKKFQLDAETFSESLERLNSSMDPKSLAKKSNPQVLMALEGDEPAIKRNEQRLAALRELSSNVVPLKSRRVPPTKPTSAVSLCDWADGEDTVRRGETLKLKSNADNMKWELQTSSGKTRTLPGACFMVPPPDAEALEKVNSLERALTDLKTRRSALMASLKNPTVEVVPQKAVAVQSAPENPRAAELASELDKINKALERSEKEILSRLRAPLDNRNPTQDLTKRLQEHEKSAQAVRKLESEKSAVQREMEPILAKKPLGPNASTLPLKLSTASNKINDINALIELYNKKATASMFLEKQKQTVEDIVSGFEEKLAKDGVILDQPKELQSRNQQLQALRQDVTSKKDELTKLGRDLETTMQSCRSLQQSFNEYCPDIRRQEDEVKLLKNRYTAVNNQLQERACLIKEGTSKNQDFQNAVRSLDFFLVNLPNNAIKPTDDVAEMKAKQNSQKRVVEDIKKKSDDLDRVKYLSRDLQSVLNEYDNKSKTYRSTLYDDNDDDDDNDDEPVLKIRKTSTMAQAVQRKEKDLLNLFSEVSAENDLLLRQLGTARNIKARNEEQVSQVVVNQQLQQQSQMKNLEQSDSLKKELNEQIERRLHAEKDLETYRKRFVSLKSRRGVERLEEKEVVQYYRDPKLEADIMSLRSRIQDETLKRSRILSEIEIMNEKIIIIERQLTTVEPKLVTKLLYEYERDPQLDKEAAKMRDEMQRIRLELQTRDTESVHVKTELTVLSQQKPKIREKIVKKEVVRLEKDPEMLKAVLTFHNDIAQEESQFKLLNDHIFSIRSQINTLERVIPTIQPKIVTKVVKKVQQDPEMLEESRKLRIALEEEKDENVILMKDLTTLQLRYGEVDKLRSKVEVKEIVNEIYRVDPDTEVELVRLRKELQDTSRNSTDVEKEIKTITTTLTTLRSQKPKVEYKEVTQEIIKEEKSPEVTRELHRLNTQVSHLRVNYDTTLELLTHLRKERNELKAEKSKVETKLVTKELIKYENDPLLEKEADRLRRNVREEIQQRRSLEECLYDLQNQYIILERQKPEEKIVMQEVVRLQRDPTQVLEHEKLNKNLDEEMKTRRKIEMEVRQLRVLIQDKENTLAQTDDRQRKIQVESELRQIKSRIIDLESSPPPVEEKIVIEEILKVERDPKLEKLTDGIRVDLETESTNISRLQREISNLQVRLEILQKEKSIEKVVYREVVRVEKDPAVEAEREHLRDLLTQERNHRRDQEEKIQNIHIRITHLQTTKSVSSQEGASLVANRDALQREKEDNLRQLKMLESQRQEISITFQQKSKQMSEMNQIVRQRSLKTSSEIQRLEKEILNEKDKIHERNTLIMELQNNVKKEDHSETHTRETNLSTKITILDPETGKDMSPYEAYTQGLIDRNHYIRLSELECDWEEITSTGPDGDTTILQDRKSGKQFSVKDALRSGRLTQYDVSRYKEGKMSISEFALMVVGETKKPFVPPITVPRSPTKPIPSSPLKAMPPSLRSSYPSLNTYHSGNLNNYNAGSLTNLNAGSLTNLSASSLTNHSASSLTNHSAGSLNNLTASAGDEHFPISGVLDTITESRMSVRSALTRKLIDADTALKLLEAQAASGGIVDLNKKDKLSVHKAAERGLIDTNDMYKLLNAQKAFTGVEDPVTKDRLAVGQAAMKGYIPQENARRYMEAQYLTGGFVNPAKAGRLTIKEALAINIIDSTTADQLQNEASHTKELVDPITKEKISYKQAMDRCKRDISTGLLLLPAASTDATNAPSYSNYRFSRV